jgi:hypothetical protein
VNSLTLFQFLNKGWNLVVRSAFAMSYSDCKLEDSTIFPLKIKCTQGEGGSFENLAVKMQYWTTLDFQTTPRNFSKRICPKSQGFRWTLTKNCAFCIVLVTQIVDYVFKYF